MFTKLLAKSSKKKSMSKKDVKSLTVDEKLQEDVKQYNELLNKIDELTAKKNRVEAELIQSIKAYKGVKNNQYYDIGKAIVGISQGEASFSTNKAKMEAKLKELNFNLEQFKVKGAVPKATLKVEMKAIEKM